MKLYWYSAIDNNWDSLGNWWSDSGHTVHATSLPGSSDSVVILASPSDPLIDLDDGIFVLPLESDGPGLITATSAMGLEFTQQAFTMNTGSLKIEGNTLVSSVNSISMLDGDCYVQDTAQIGTNSEANISGNLYLGDYAQSNNYLNCQNAYCRDHSSTQGGTIYGDANYYDNAYNGYSIVGGNMIFNARKKTTFGPYVDPTGGYNGGLARGGYVFNPTASAAVMPTI